MVLNDKLYKILKWICIFFLPALASLIRVIFLTWDFNVHLGDQISATIVAVNAFLGAILGISAYNYNKGAGTATEDEEEDYNE